MREGAALHLGRARADPRAPCRPAPAGRPRARAASGGPRRAAQARPGPRARARPPRRRALVDELRSPWPSTHWASTARCSTSASAAALAISASQGSLGTPRRANSGCSWLAEAGGFREVGVQEQRDARGGLGRGGHALGGDAPDARQRLDAGAWLWRRCWAAAPQDVVAGSLTAARRGAQHVVTAHAVLLGQCRASGVARRALSASRRGGLSRTSRLDDPPAQLDCGEHVPDDPSFGPLPASGAIDVLATSPHHAPRLCDARRASTARGRG